MTADQPGAVVLIDGERRGAAGQPITDVCHGEHAVDVRSPTGQFSQRVTVEFDKEVRDAGKAGPDLRCREHCRPGRWELVCKSIVPP